MHDHRHDGKLYNSRASFREAAKRINHYLSDWDADGFRSGFMFHNIEWIRSCGGMALLNLHPDYVTFPGRTAAEDEFPVARYEEFLTWVKGNYGGQHWHALAKEVADFHRRQVGAHRDVAQG